MNLNCPRTQNTPPHTLHFGDYIDGQPRTIVILDLLGFHTFIYDDDQQRYLATPEESLWRLKLCECTNADVLDSLTLPGNRRPEQYKESGLDNLAYIALLFAHPELAEYADNPGLLVLLISYYERIGSLLAQSPDRIELIKALSPYEQVGSFHLKWLKKIRPGSVEPAYLADKIRNSLLRVPVSDRSAPKNSYAARRYKLFTHQKQWLTRGLEFARALIQRDDINLNDIGYLLDRFNGDEPRIITKAKQAMLQFRGYETYLNNLVRRRACYTARHEQILTLRFAQRFRRSVLRSDPRGDLVDLCALFLTDEDIPAPLLLGNNHVEPLNTLSKLRAHARNARNCVWSQNILSDILSRRVDVYVVNGKNNYTLSLDRHTLDIRMLEPFRGNAIISSDLRLIVEWFEEATVLPR